jgi:histidine triad (HIT) family protein
MYSERLYNGFMQNQPEDSIFTKIIKGEIPCHKVYEDDKTLAFLDIHPVQPGMTLVVSKTQAPTFMDLGDEDYQALWVAVKKVAQRLKEAFPDKAKIGIQVEGLDVPHVHVKLIPINSGEEFHAASDMDAEPDHAALSELAKTLAF